ncbi:hypothetical protein STEG23_038162 [Scotinomys teguina]
MGVPESRIRVWFQNRNRTRGVQQGPRVAQPPGPFQDTADEDHDDNDDSQPHPVARNTCPVDTKDIEFCLDQLRAELEADQPSQDTLDPDVAWEPIDQTLELPLEEQVYQALLQALL